MKSSPPILCYVVSVKWTVKISAIFVAFLENMNFKVWIFYEVTSLRMNLWSVAHFFHNLQMLNNWVNFWFSIVKELWDLAQEKLVG